MKNFKSNDGERGGRDRRDDRSSFGKRDSGRDNFKSGGFNKSSFGGKSFSKGADFKKRSFNSDRNEVVMSKATCSECSNICEVPFKPNGERPVFCSNCFMSKRDGTFEKKDERKENFRENDRREKRDSYSLPASSTPSSSAEVADMKKQISNLNTKIDSLANAFDKFISEKESVAAAPKKTEVAPVTKTEKKTVVKTVSAKKVVAKKEVAKSSVKAPAKKETITKVVTKKAAPAVVKKVVAKKVTTKTVATKKSVATKKVVAKKN